MSFRTPLNELGILRWLRFNLVGAMGMAVQLAALALFNRALRGHYLWASAAAVELTLLHNFLWHQRFTWRDRRDAAPWPQQLWRFHLSNGLVSLLGNLALMQLLVHAAHLPLLLANTLAILSCSVANFWLGNRWAFAATSEATHGLKKGLSAMRRISVLIFLASLILAPASAQSPDREHPGETRTSSSSASQIDAPGPQLAPAPKATPIAAYHGQPSDSYLLNAGAFCGTGASASSISVKPTVGCGVGIVFLPLPVFFEVGIMAPQANRSYVTGYISVDGSIPLAPSRTKYLPLAIVGYSRLFETGHSLDYGIALALPRPGKTHKDDSSSLRLELRDYYTFASPNQHNVMLRIGLMEPASD
jgi:putative flippase GtrA